MQICFAAPTKNVPREDIAIGGVYFGATKDYVQSIYGEPDKVFTKKQSKGAEPPILELWQYGDSFIISFNPQNDKVEKIESTKRNGLKIPMGAAVGDNIFAVKNYYDGKCFFASEKNGYVLRLQASFIYMMLRANSDAEITNINIYPGV